MTSHRPLPRRVWLPLLAGLAVAAIGGCAPRVDTGPHPVWPPPPAAKRVVHLSSARQTGDLVPPSFFQGLGQALTGGSTLKLLRPSSIAVVEDTRLYVTDQERQGVVVLDLKASRTTLIERAGDTFLVSPVGVALCQGKLAVADSALNAVYLFDAAGKLARTFQKPEGFLRPTGLAYDAGEGLLYVVDTLANEVCVFELSSGALVRRFGSPGNEPGQFNYPTHICLDASGRVYVTDSLNFRVQVLDKTGGYLFELGRQGDASGHLAVPKGVAVDGLGHIYIVDSYLAAIQIFDQQGRFLLSIGQPGEQNGDFQVPTGLTIDTKNRIYVCDSLNKRIQILQYVGAEGDEDQGMAP